MPVVLTEVLNFAPERCPVLTLYLNTHVAARCDDTIMMIITKQYCHDHEQMRGQGAITIYGHSDVARVTWQRQVHNSKISAIWRKSV